MGCPAGPPGYPVFRSTRYNDTVDPRGKESRTEGVQLTMLTAAKRISMRILIAGAAVPVLAACTSAVVVESEFPTPLVEPSPLSMGLYFEDELRNFIHAEALPRRSTWTIDLGDANVAMLGPLYGTMFSSTREFETLPPPPAQASIVDGVLASTLEEFQFDVPQSSRDEFVEVWLQYRLTLLDGNDVVIEWFVPGYGKAEIDGNREEAVHRASIVAMREAGARISTQFMQQPAVQTWLRGR